MQRRILFLTPRYPFPLIGGDRVKAYHLLRILAERYNVTCVSFSEEGKPSPARLDAIRDLGVDIHVIPLSKLKAIARVGLTAFSNKPFEVQYYSDARFRRIVESLHAQSPFDLAISFFMRTAEYALALPRVSRILIAEDARHLTQQRATASFHASSGYIMRTIERHKLMGYEPRIVDAFNVVTYVSGEERTYMERLNPRLRAAVVTNGVDLDEFHYSADQTPRQGIVLCGKMDVMHNVRMAMRAGKDIFPALRKTDPTLEFHIVGKNPSPDILKLARRTPGIVVTGEVSRVQPHIQSAAVFLHPQDTGSGIQNKLLEAMALGTAIVTTPLGVSGIRARDGAHLRITETTGECIAACKQLLASPGERGRLAANARRLVEQEYTWETVAEQLCDVVEQVMRSPHGSRTLIPSMEAVL